MSLKTKIFDSGLYIEAIRRLRLPGIISAVVLLGNGFLVSAWNWLNYAEYGVLRTDTVSYVEYQTLVYVFMLLLVPVMILYLFSFLNHRNADDFYHSIPQTRTCVALSFLAAAITWIFAIILVSGLVSSLFMDMIPGVIVQWTSLWIQMFNFFCGCIMAAGIVLTAMMLTGTLFNNIVVSLMIAGVPSLALTWTALYTIDSVDFILGQDLSPLLTGKYNMLTGWLTTQLINRYADTNYVAYYSNSSAYLDVLNSPQSGLFSGVIGIILMIIGIVLFRKRKSEMAGNAAFNRYVQAALRICATMVICLIPITMLCYYLLDSYQMDCYDWFTLIVLYVIAIFFYYMYELVTTKNPGNLKRIHRGVLVVVLLNVLWVGCQYATVNHRAHDCPDKDEIVSVSLLRSGTGYWDAQMQAVELESEEVRTLVYESLTDTIALWDNYKSTSIGYVYSEDKDKLSTSYRVALCINTTKGRLFRRVVMGKSTYERFMTQIEENEEFVNSITTLPDYEHILSLDVYGSMLSLELTESQSRELYDIYRNEFRRKDFKEVYEDISGNYYYDNDIVQIHVSLKQDGQIYDLTLGVGTSSPDTLNYIRELSYSAIEDAVEDGVLADDNLLGLIMEDNIWMEIWLYNVEDDDMVDTHIYWDGLADEIPEEDRNEMQTCVDALTAELDKTKQSDITQTGWVAAIGCYLYDATSYYENGKTYIGGEQSFSGIYQVNEEFARQCQILDQLASRLQDELWD